MLPVSLILSVGTAFIFSVAVPIILLFVLGIQRKITFSSLLTGGLYFFLLRVFLVNMISTLLSSIPFISTIINTPVIAMLITIFLISTTDILGRKYFYSHSKKKCQDFRSVLGLGLGQGFFEVQITIGLNALNCLFITIALFTHQESIFLAQGASSADLTLAIEAFKATDPMIFIESSIFSIATLLLHCVLAFLIQHSIRLKDSPFNLIIAWVLSLTLNSIQLFIANFNNVLAAIFAIIWILYLLFWIKRKDALSLI